MPALFGLGDKVIGNPAIATFAEFGSFAMLLLVDFTGPMRDRLQAQAALAAVGALFICLGMLACRWNGIAPTAVAMIASSLFFFAATNFAVWAFDTLYPTTFQGLVQCYIAALPFLDRSVLGDVAWASAFFGGAWLVLHGPALAKRAL